MNVELQTNLIVALGYLEMAVTNTFIEYPIREYIKFMNKLSKTEQDLILMNPKVTALCNRINNCI